MTEDAPHMVLLAEQYLKQCGPDTSYLAACRMRDYAISPDKALELLTAHHPEPPAKGYEEKIEHAARYAQNEYGCSYFKPASVAFKDALDQMERQGLAEVRISMDNVKVVVDAAEAALISRKVDIFKRGEGVVRLGEVTVHRRDGKDTTQQGIVPVSTNSLCELLGQHVRFMRFDGRAKDWKASPCPPLVSATYLDRPTRKLRPLMGIVNAPTLATRWNPGG